MEMKLTDVKGEDVAKEAFWLAWNACGGPVGMGFLQDRSGVTKDNVWQNVQRNGDYTCDPRNLLLGCADGDYVFGRMMKLRIRYTDDMISTTDGNPRPDYQAWARKYPTYEALIDAAIKNLKGV